MEGRSVLILSILSILAAGAAPCDRHGDPLPDGAIARLGTIRQRVAASEIALSADGRTIITIAGGRIIGRWDAATGRLRGFRRLPGLPVSQSWLSHDGQLIAVTEGKSLAVFDTTTGARKCLLAVSAMHVAFRPDGRALVTSEYEKERCHVRLWDLATGKGRLLAELPSYVNEFAFRADGKRLFAAVDNHSLRCWDLDGFQEVWKNDHWANRLAVSPDGRTLCANAYQQPGLHLWDAGTGRHLGEILTGKGRWTGRVAFAPDGRTGFVLDHQDILLWDAATRTVRRRLSGAGGAYAVAPDCRTLVSIVGSQLRRWDVETGKSLYPDTAADGHTNAVQGVIFTPDGRSIVTAGGDGMLLAWGRSDQRPRILATGIPYRLGIIYAGTPDGWHPLFVPPVLDVTADGRRLLSAGGDGQLRLTDIKTGEEVRRFDVQAGDKQATVGTARLSPDGRAVWALTHHWPQPSGSLILEQKETLIAWDTATGRRLPTRSVLCGNFPNNVIAPHGRAVVVESGDVRDVTSDENRPQQRGESVVGPPHAFSVDSRLLAGITNQGHGDQAGVKELLTGRLLMRGEASVSWSSRFAFSPDGRMLIAAGTDALHVWEVSSGRRLMHLPAEGRLPASLPGAFATCLAVAPDGRSAATGHEDGTVLLWDLAPAWKRLAEHATPPLTAAQLDGCWADLRKDDPRPAYAAIDRLAAVPTQALPLLRKHLRPVTIDSQWLADCLAALDSSDFAAREKASHDLEAVAEVVEPLLRREMEQTASSEVRARLRRLLEAPRPLVPSAGVVRQLRAVAVLERLADPEARDLLRELARGAPAARLTIAVADALARLATVPAQPKP